MSKEKSGSLEWMQDAACMGYDTNRFFPVDEVGVERAKRVCQGCLVQEVCLEYAITQRIDDGVWGGASEANRRSMRRRKLRK